MSEAAPTVSVEALDRATSVVKGLSKALHDLVPADDFASTLRRLLADLAATNQAVSDPIVIAAEAAVGALCGVGGPGLISETVLRLMPANTTPFERGLAVGMALVLGLPALPWRE